MTRSRALVLTVVVLALVLGMFPALVYAEEATIERVSVDKAGEDADGASGDSSIGADGTLVVFESTAPDLVTDDSNGKKDVFVRDLETGVTELVSVSSDEVQGNKKSANPDITADGRYVAFQSKANNLVDSDVGGYLDIFVRDLVEGTTTLMSQSSGGVQANGDSVKAAVASDDTRVYVAYQSVATNLVGSDTNGGVSDVFLSYFYKTDPTEVYTELVSRRTNGSQGTNAQGCVNPDISADGTYVVYESGQWLENDGGYTDSDYLMDIYVTDWDKDGTIGHMVTQHASVKTGGDETTDAHCKNPSISADGKYVAYDSESKGLVDPGDTKSKNDVFVTDWNHEDEADVVTVKASVSTSGLEANGDSARAALSGDGRYVTFQSGAKNLVEGDSNGKKDIFIRDLIDGVTYLVSVDTEGVQGNGKSVRPAITATSGEVFPGVSFQSNADNLIKGVADANGATDVFAVVIPKVETEETATTKAVSSKRYEQNDERILYTGGFDEEENDSHSEGSAYLSADKDFSVTITFKGTKLDWIGTLGPEMGQVMVSVDGGEAVLVDFSNPETLSNTLVWTTGDLTYGVHVVKIYFPEDSDADDLKAISIDALDIYGGYLMQSETPEDDEAKKE